MTPDVATVVVAALALIGTALNTIFGYLKAKSATRAAQARAVEAEECAEHLREARAEIRELRAEVERQAEDLQRLKVENSRLMTTVWRLQQAAEGDGR